MGSGFRVQGCGGGFAANIYEAMPEGLMNCCYARIVSPLAVMVLSYAAERSWLPIGGAPRRGCASELDF